MPAKGDIANALRQIRRPGADRNIVEAGIVSDITVNGSIVSILLEIPRAEADAFEPVRAACEKAALAVPGVTRARAVMTAAKPADAAPAAPRAVPPPPTPKSLAGVKHVIAVASGKGGVGKSTTAVNLAFALSTLGLRVGLVDCDIYGPSLGKMLRLEGPARFSDQNRIRPHFRDGVAAMSMALVVDPDTAAIWRGPMVISAVQQFLTGVDWNENGDLDILVADLPPGTGDVPLTLAQTAVISGAVVVSTPQDIALIDARKALDMFAKTKTPVLGIIENMSYFACPHCGERADIFGHGGARRTAEERGVPFLGEIPLHVDIRSTSDEGAPIVLTQSDSVFARAYADIARGVIAALAPGGRA